MKQPKMKTGGNGDAAHESNNESLRDQAPPVNTYGTQQLCAWRVGKGQFWFQTTLSHFARKLAKRRDARRVEVSGLNHYRQTFEIRGTRRKVQRIIKRYLVSALTSFPSMLRQRVARKSFRRSGQRRLRERCYERTC
jgi:hypothetical protein